MMNTRPQGYGTRFTSYAPRPPYLELQPSTHRFNHPPPPPPPLPAGCPRHVLPAQSQPQLQLQNTNNIGHGNMNKTLPQTVSLNNNYQTRVQKPNRPPFQKLLTMPPGDVSNAPKRQHDGDVMNKSKLNDDANNQNEAIPASLMQPLFCKVCNVNLNAPAQAKQHYEGKNHVKKMKQYLENSKTENTEETVQEEEQKESQIVTPAEPQLTQDINPEVYCKICEASFNSTKQAEQHYQGKNHAKRIRATHTATNPVTSETTANNKQPTKFVCFVCNIHLTSQDQLDSHLQGVKHLTKIKMQERSQTALKGRWGDDGGSPSGLQNQIAAGIRKITESSTSFSPPQLKKRKRDFSNYRTPSGNYYCSGCNVTLSTEGQFAQHVDSKKHKATNASKRTYFDMVAEGSG